MLPLEEVAASKLLRPELEELGPVPEEQRNLQLPLDPLVRRVA